MRHMRLMGLVVAVMSWGVPAGFATFIDFESVTPTPQPGDLLAAYGIASITQSGSGINLPFQVRNVASVDHLIPSGNNVFMPAGYWYPSTGVAETTLTFSTPVSFFSFKKMADAQALPTIGIAGWKVEAFAAGGALVDSNGIGFAGGLDFPTPAIQSFTLSGAQVIEKVVFTVNYTGASTFGTVPVDDFSFEPAIQPVPLPAAALGGSALLGLLVLTRRASAASA